MKILSFDVGIKNLAYTLLDNEVPMGNSEPYTVLDWKLITLIDPPIIQQPILCCHIPLYKKSVKKQKCTKKATFRFNQHAYCKLHLPQNLLMPITNTAMNKYKKHELADIINYKGNDLTRDELIKRIKSLMLTPIKHVKEKPTTSNDMGLIEIGKNINRILTPIFADKHLDYIIIENQISPIATRMKSIQSMLAMYFTMSHPESIIEFISSTNKLKDFFIKENAPIIKTPAKMIKGVITLAVEDAPEINPNYKEHKLDGIKYCKDYLGKIDPDNNLDITKKFNELKKKDDVADSYLQGVWFVKHRLAN